MEKDRRRASPSIDWSSVVRALTRRRQRRFKCCGPETNEEVGQVTRGVFERSIHRKELGESLARHRACRWPTPSKLRGDPIASDEIPGPTASGRVKLFRWLTPSVGSWVDSPVRMPFRHSCIDGAAERIRTFIPWLGSHRFPGHDLRTRNGQADRLPAARGIVPAMLKRCHHALRRSPRLFLKPQT